MSKTKKLGKILEKKIKKTPPEDVILYSSILALGACQVSNTLRDDQYRIPRFMGSFAGEMFDGAFEGGLFEDVFGGSGSGEGNIVTMLAREYVVGMVGAFIGQPGLAQRGLERLTGGS
jgi:hypothetical protein